MWSKLSKKVKLLICIGIPVLLLLAVGTWLTLAFLVPWLQAENTMDPTGIISIYEQEDGSLRVTWPAGENAESHTLQVLSTKGGTEELLYGYTTVGECSCVLPELPSDEEVTLRITSAHSYRDTERSGEAALETRVTLKAPAVEKLRHTVDPDTDLMEVTFRMEEDEVCYVYASCAQDTQTPILELEQQGFTLSFGEKEQYPVPEYGQEDVFSFKLQRYGENYVFFGDTSGQITLVREDFLGTVLMMDHTENGSNSYTLTWNETKGEHYEIQRSQDNLHWETVHSVAKEGALTYTTDHLEPFETFYFQVIALSADGEPSAQPDSVELKTAQKTVYSTIWPLMELDVYAAPDKQTAIGKVSAGTACSVLEERDGMFAIRYDSQTTGYIDSNYCMINLPEFLGDLCAYNITNSYDSIYMVHEFAIDQVTGTVIKGYENVLIGESGSLTDRKEPYELTGKEEFLAPLLYPAAKKLVVAALDAQNQGYRLKLYDTFRPREATLSIYDLTEKLIGELVPKSAYTGKPLEDLEDMKWELTMDIPQWVIDGYPKDSKGNYIKPEPVVIEPTVPGDTVGETTDETTGDTTGETTAETTGGTTEPELTDEQFQQMYLMRDLTYQIFMTDNGRYKLSNFLAKGMSNHNIGIAMDLTLEKLSGNGEEVEMQTSIHDLSWFSESARNNTGAKTLRKIMEAAGFGGLGSEWWHYQDNDAKAELGLTPLHNGISPKGWVRDDHGWRYRLATGAYYKDCTKTIDNMSYTFDENGYVVEN